MAGWYGTISSFSIQSNIIVYNAHMVSQRAESELQQGGDGEAGLWEGTGKMIRLKVPPNRGIRDKTSKFSFKYTRYGREVSSSTMIINLLNYCTLRIYDVHNMTVPVDMRKTAQKPYLAQASRGCSRTRQNTGCDIRRKPDVRVYRFPHAGGCSGRSKHATDRSAESCFAPVRWTGASSRWRLRWCGKRPRPPQRRSRQWSGWCATPTNPSCPQMCGPLGFRQLLPENTQHTLT